MTGVINGSGGTGLRSGSRPGTGSVGGGPIPIVSGMETVLLELNDVEVGLYTAPFEVRQGVVTDSLAPMVANPIRAIAATESLTPTATAVAVVTDDLTPVAPNPINTIFVTENLGQAQPITVVATGQGLGSEVQSFDISAVDVLDGDVIVLFLQGYEFSGVQALPSGNTRTFVGQAIASQQMALIPLAAGDHTISWPPPGPPDFGDPARYGWAIFRGCDPVTPVSSRANGSNGTAGLALTAARDGSVNLQCGTFGSASSLAFTGGGFAPVTDGVTALDGTSGWGTINFLEVDIADGANGPAGSYANTAVRGAMMLQPPLPPDDVPIAVVTDDLTPLALTVATDIAATEAMTTTVTATADVTDDAATALT